MSEIKLCKDCKHFKNDSEIIFGSCRSEKNIKINLVSGKSELIYKFAETCRLAIISCGEDAKWFEPKPVKPSLWQRIIGVAK